LEPSGRYRVVRKLGEGGMGVVYAAHDDRLDRPVAIKRIRPGHTGGQERQRFWREARAAASVSHPNVCQLYEIDEDQDGLFLAMELLDGEALSERLARGSLPAGEAIQIALAVLSALAALHQKGIVHRDLKPSNIFLSVHGVKLLDFGLARPFVGAAESSESDLTLPGVVFGTPRYLAPELIEGRVADARTDLFVLGIVLYEMLVGQPPFRGDSVIDVAQAILKDEPPALGGSPGVVGLDRIVHRALRKPVDERYQAADAFAQDLRSTLLGTDTVEVSRIRPLSRLVVLPFRMLRPNPSIDFLSFSLADAVSSALSGLPSLVVRSTAVASRFVADTPDIPALSRALDVDVVLLGTLLSSGDQVRVSAQLVEAPSGTLVGTMTAQSQDGDVFHLQDSLAKSIVESLSLSLTPADQDRINRDAPANPEAYDAYLRANQIQLDSRQWASARDLYLRCLERDPQFAPAWARLGRCYRLLGKYEDPSQARANLALGEQALKRALDINPDLSLAHNLYAHVEVDAGHAREAVARLLERVRQAGSEPELFVGLVQACRYCGLLEASVAAYERARRLDPGVVTSAAQTFLLKGDLARAVDVDRSDPPFTKASALAQLGRGSEGLALLRASVARGLHPQLENLVNGMIAALEGRHDDVIRETYRAIEAGLGDHEVFYHWAGGLAQAGDHDGALRLLERSILGGFHPASALVRDPRFDPVRGTADFRQIMRRADELQRDAFETFRAANGPRLLGLPQV
jgi:serine/threonine protein kinase/tetratricopeptide (TPR) repeat protein